MKVLVTNNYFYLRGGCERVMFNDREALERSGVTVIPFSAADPANVATEYAKYFVPGADIRATDMVGRVKAAADAIHCTRTAKAFGRIIDDTQPDVVHCHNIYGRLSTSLLAVARERRLPVVLTVHDYKVVCPSYLMLRDGKPCTSCLDGGYYRCAAHSCHKGNRAASMVYAIEAYYARATDHYAAVSAFLCPSRFIAGLLKQSGIAAERVIYHQNCVEPEQYRPSYQGDYAFYAGRLSHEKGLPTLLEAMKGSKIPLRIAGSGPMEEKVRTLAEAQGETFTLEGHCEGERLAELYRNAAFVVVPSEWYENAPMAVLEAFAYGKPVIGTRIGGIPELLADGEHGHLVEAGAPAELRAAIFKLWENREAQARMGRNARHLIETRFSQRTRTDSLLQIYRRLSGCSSEPEFSAPRVLAASAASR